MFCEHLLQVSQIWPGLDWLDHIQNLLDNKKVITFRCLNSFIPMFWGPCCNPDWNPTVEIKMKNINFIDDRWLSLDYANGVMNKKDEKPFSKKSSGNIKGIPVDCSCFWPTLIMFKLCLDEDEKVNVVNPGYLRQLSQLLPAVPPR